MLAVKHPARLVAASIAEAERAGLPPEQAARLVRRLLYAVTDQIERAAINHAGGAGDILAWAALLRSETGIQVMRAARR